MIDSFLLRELCASLFRLCESKTEYRKRHLAISECVGSWLPEIKEDNLIGIIEVKRAWR